jgi:hypothetical protein
MGKSGLQHFGLKNLMKQRLKRRFGAVLGYAR